MQIETLAVDRLIPYARNSRTHSEAQVAQIAASMREFGFTNPVLVDADGGIIAGHGRVMAARQLGLAEVPCIRLGHLTEAQKRAYIIAAEQTGRRCYAMELSPQYVDVAVRRWQQFTGKTAVLESTGAAFPG
jgi:ParB-like chromosome segregation protein Spo0J